MKIKAKNNLESIEFIAHGGEVPKVTGAGDNAPKEIRIHSFKNPVLITDIAAIAALNSTKRDLLARLLEFPERVVEYDGISLRWSDIDYPGVWSPSIDTLLFAKALRKLFLQKNFSKKIRSFLEIGCGSGFLSKYILKKKIEAKDPVRYAHLMDINKDALRCASDNLEELRGNTLISYSLNSPKKMLHVINPYDLVICNPPYIPKLNENPNNPFEGLFLYEEILKRSGEMLRRGSKLIINFSSLSKARLFPEYKKVFDMRAIYKLRVPLKIPLITAGYSTESRKWMKYLEKEKEIIIDKKEKSGYKYWQIIEITECSLI